MLQNKWKLCLKTDTTEFACKREREDFYVIFSEPIGVAEYKIVSTLPEKLKGKLPSPEEISKFLEEIK
ncbi:hypothetical protein MSBR3_2407 [Methanosarcina barkeri 3]|uniref:Uncharacterized protein n=1 Tax=Methanosarcina barkeri 3 TaxID=1434107 RepID=A0A0E3WXI8_METBA|nr:hypothetical protein [Methanosarcina barkeri]AKB82985.1 hypothetical protein MSBR3_2407 [Methanosarcina barkeri 3]